MQRRIFLRNTAFTVGALSLLKQQSFASFLQDNPCKMRALRNDVGIFYEKGGTIAYLLSKKGIVVVDAEFPEQATHLITELKKQSDKSFELLLNTHHHGDHTAGNIAFKGIVPHVAAHANSLTNQKKIGRAHV